MLDKAASEGMRGTTRKALVQEFTACGFDTGYSCVTWQELRNLLPNVADVLGHSIAARHRLRSA